MALQCVTSGNILNRSVMRKKAVLVVVKVEVKMEVAPQRRGASSRQ